MIIVKNSLFVNDLPYGIGINVITQGQLPILKFQFNRLSGSYHLLRTLFIYMLRSCLKPTLFVFEIWQVSILR